MSDPWATTNKRVKWLHVYVVHISRPLFFDQLGDTSKKKRAINHKPAGMFRVSAIYLITYIYLPNNMMHDIPFTSTHLVILFVTYLGKTRGRHVA